MVRMSTGNSLNAPQRWWRDNSALIQGEPPNQMTLTKKSTVTKNSTHDDGGTTQHPPPCGVSYMCLLLTMTPVPRSPAPRHNNPTCAELYMKAASVQRWEIAQILQCRGYQLSIKGEACGYGCMVLVLRWCAQCVVLVRLRCMRVRVVPIPSASLPIFYLQTRRSESFGELTMRTVKLFHNTKEVRWMITTDLVQSQAYSLSRNFGPRRFAEQIIEQTSHRQEWI